MEQLDQHVIREGLSLHDRLRAASARCSGGELPVGCDSPHAAAHLEAWRRIVAPDQPINFLKRLTWDGLTEAHALWALQSHGALLPTEPSWWELLQQIRQAAQQQACGALLEEAWEERGSQWPFVHAWRPVAAWALRELRQRCSKLPGALLLTDAAWLDLSTALLERLCNTADQALWELFNQRRTPGQMLLAHLGMDGDGSGELVCEAYNAFIHDLLINGYAPLLNQFPVLGRLLAVVCDLWLEASEEMLKRIGDSRLELEDQFQIPTCAVLARAQLGLSDPHRGGRTVAILSFEIHGESSSKCDPIKVVYKPKDMQVDSTFQGFLESLNKISTLSPLRVLNVLTRPGYGFMEWVEHRLCRSDDELEQFYINAGRTMALLYLLGCTDCHHENLIASGDQLLLIDTETLLEADLRDLLSAGGDDADALSPLQTSMQGSVLRSGLLPYWVMVGAGRKHLFDISALGIQPPPVQVERSGWLGLNSDGMMAGRTLQPSDLPTSLPVGLGSPQRLTHFVDALCAGFECQLQEVLRLRPQLAIALERFKGQPRRLVARNTRLYFTILRQMLEPAALRSAVAHGLKLEQLSRCFVLANEKPPNWPLFEAELRQMERLDIPFFEHQIDAEDLPLPEGMSPIPAFMKRSGLDAARHRLAALDTDEIQFQKQLIRGAVAARHLTQPVTRPALQQQVSPAQVVELVSPDGYRSEAFRLGQAISSSAIRDRRGRPEWLGLDLGADGESFHFGLIGHGLYSGSSGIAVLFARLALFCQAGGDPDGASLWSKRSWSCLSALAEMAERNTNDQLFRLVRDEPYGISGSGGILLALNLLQRANLAEAADLSQRLIGQLRPERLRADEILDLIGGITGLIGPLLLSGTEEALALASVCGERLLEMQLDSGGWPPTHHGRPPYTGLSHGAAGMAAALARLAQATGEARFADGALRAVAYERSVFVVESGNWPDFRKTREPNEFMLSWCHGAPGILLSRLVLQTSGLADEHTNDEIAVARRSTVDVLGRLNGMREVPTANLCCGVLGLTSLLRCNAAQTGICLPAVVHQSEMALIAQAQSSGRYRFSVDSECLNLPGLFTGHAGLALAFAEVADGFRWLPSVLTAGLLAPR